MVQRGDDRQYLPSGIAERNNIGAYANMINDVMGATQSIAQQANQSDLASKQIDLSTEWYKKNNEINLKYQADPTNPQRETDLQEAFTAISDKYKVNPFCEKQWGEIKRNVFDRTKMYNAQWAEKQQETNAQTNLKDGYEKLVNQVSMLGMNGAGIDDIRLTYANGVEALRTGATAVLGEVVTNNFLQDATHDMMSTYISTLAVDNPLKAQELLKDESVRNDIGRAETLEKLESYVSNSLMNKNKRVAVDELGTTLRNMNSAEADEIINGKADLNKVMKFIENNKGLAEGSKNMILDIYGLGSKTEYYYDRDKKKIVKKEEGGSGGRGGGRSGGSLVSLKKLSKTEKAEYAYNLESGLNEMFFEGDVENVNAKKVLKNKQGEQYQSAVLDRLKSVAQAQGSIDTAWSAGIIGKDQRQSMINKYIEPMTNYLEANMQDLDEKKGLWGTKLGYGRLKSEFSVEGIPAKNKNEIRMKKSMLLTAQSRYYDNLANTAQKLKKNSIYELETLSKADQEKIYKTASDDAINYAKKYGAHPEIFFKKEYPQIYSIGVQAFGIKDGNSAAKQIAKEIYGAEDMSKVDVNKVASNVFANTRAYKNQKTKELVDTIIAVNKNKDTNPDARVLSNFEIEERANRLGLTMKQLTNDAYSKRVSPQMYLIYLENLKKGIK